MAGGLVEVAGLYRCPNVRLEGQCVYTNTVPSGPYRVFGAAQIVFAAESQMDRIAEELGLDPFDLRLKNATRSGDITVVGQKVDSCGLEECMERVADYTGWKEKRKEKQTNRGIGMACAMYLSDGRVGDYAGSTAYVKILKDGRIRVISGEFDWGQGSHTILLQIAAEELGVPIEAIDFSEFDTDAVPYALGPSGGGRITLVAGHAVKLAAIDAKRKLLTVAAKMLGVGIEDLEIENQKIFFRGKPAEVLSIAQVASNAINGTAKAELIGKGVYEPDTVNLDRKTLYGNPSSAYPFVAQVAEVEVDPETGHVEVLDFATAVDLGKAINPMSAEGQCQGSVGQEIGTALMEEVNYEGGTVVNPNFGDYRIPTAVNIPPVKVFLVETNDPHGPYGAKACGMTNSMPVAAAIANAIYNAVGVRIKELPITPMKILQALETRMEKE